MQQLACPTGRAKCKMGWWHVACAAPGWASGALHTSQVRQTCSAGLSQNPNCSNAAGKAVANDMQLTCSFDRPECLECSSHGTCRMARLTCQMHCHLLGVCVEPRGNTHGTPRIQCYFPKAVLSPAAVTTDRARDPCVTGAQIRHKEDLQA